MTINLQNQIDAQSFTELKPYVGLRPFETADSPYFFGRDKQVSALVKLLGQHQFLSVIGSSGSGKSSLIKAGYYHAYIQD